MTAVVGLSASRSAPGRWSLAALILAGLGVVASAWFVAVTDADPAVVVWSLVLAPVAIALAPLLAPRTATRLGAAVAMGAWCILTGFTIGALLLPALVALIGAAIRERQ